MNCKMFAAFVSGALSCLLLFSPEVRSEEYNVDQLIGIALKNNSLLRSFEMEAKSKDQLSEQSGAWDNPTLEVETENKKESAGETKSIRYRISQTLYLPGKFSKKQQISKGEAEAAKINLASAELQFRSLILNLIYEFKASKEKLGHAQERLERFKTVEGFLRSRVFVAPQKRAEASIVGGRLIVLQKELYHIQAKTENLWNELNSYLKMSSEPQIRMTWFSKGPTLSEKELLAELLATNLDLKRQDVKIGQSKTEAELTDIESWPSLTVSGSYADGSGFNPEKIYGLGISFPLPVFNSNRAARMASGIKFKAEEERLNHIKDQARRELRSAILNLELAKKSVAGLPVKKIEYLEKAIQETDRGFKRGQVDLLTYLEADSQHFASLSAILESQLDLVRSLCDLQILTGKSQLSLEN